MVTMTTGGPTSPAKAAMLPGTPRKRDPNTTLRLTMFGPGRKWHSAKVSLNSSAVIHRCWSTMPRRAKASTPPKPDSDILANAANSANRPGGAGIGRSGTAMAAGGESGGMDQDLERAPRQGQPNSACSAAECPQTGLFFSTFAPHIEGAGSPAMEINCRRNKPFGPGGSTRRLHQSPSQNAGFGGGEPGSTRA